MTLHSVVKYKSQQGAALLIFMLILIMASSYSLLSKINAATKPHLREQATSRVLAEAKQALISYAVTYPDIVNSDYGPGYLPCPDRDNDGSTDAGTCASGSSTTIGRLPWVTLKLNDLKDSSGQRLWYVLSDNFRNNPKLEPLNSETEGQLRIDIDADGDIDANDIDDVVAIIIAPGEPINNQNRDIGETDIALEIAHYLEADNIDFDTDFVISNFDNINDKLVYITRQELMEQVEKRVLGEVNQILTNYFSTYAAYPWLSAYADPKADIKEVRGFADSGSTSTVLNDSGSSSPDFLARGIKAGDIVYNITDGSIGTVSVNPSSADSLTVSSLQQGVENDFDEDDEYSVFIKDASNVLSGTATAGSSGLILNDTSQDLTDIGIRVGDVIENVSDGSSGIIASIDADEIEVKSLSGGTINTFASGNAYQIRNNYGVATNAASSATQLLDNTKDFVVMGVQAGDLIWNITDDSMGRITAVATTELTVDSLLFGVNNNFTVADRYFLPRFNATTNVREGHLGIHEVGEPFKTDLNFDWTFTANAGDITVSNSAILQNYIDNYVASGSESFDDSIGTCIWLVLNFADCFVSYKDFVNISGNLTSGLNTVVVTDSAAEFSTDNVKRGDIAQNYDDETWVLSGTVDAGNSGIATGAPASLTLQDTNNDFLNVNISVGDTLFNTTDGSSGIIDSVTATQITVSSLSGGTDNIFEVGDDYQIGTVPTMYDASADFSVYERYSYLVQNQTLEVELGVGKIQAVLIDKEGVDTLITESYIGESSTPIEFRPGDTYQIYQPRRFVVENVSSETQLSTDNYTSSVNPDFDSNEYYRIMPASNSLNGTVDSVPLTGATDAFRDFSETFVSDGVEVGDIVENTTTGAFGEITNVLETGMVTTMYDGTSNDFTIGDSYTVYYDYVYSREHTIHSKFRGNQGTKTVSGERVRDVCLGYTSDCSSISAAVNFSGNAGVSLVVIKDYQEDEVTQVGEAAFTPTSLTSGNLRISNIDFNSMSEVNGDIPSWFIENDWHKLMYVAYSSGYAPGAAAVCVDGVNCLVLNDVDSGVVNSDKSMLVITAGAEINAQNRTNGTINEYYELANNTQSDDLFQEQLKTSNFNDQILVLETP